MTVTMEFRQVGSTGVHLSAVGFGTCQLRLVPERQAIDTLCRGFELGVNWVHTAPDYGGAERMVARAIAESGADVHVLSNASGPVEHFGWVFENTCRLLGTRRLPLFGVSGIDYCEDLGQNVFGPGGMVEFLERRRDEGRLSGIFCTTHGSPDYLEKLVTCGRFDAVMLSYNPLGFHVLSYHGKDEGKEFEVIPETHERIFPLAQERGVSLLVMKPLAGGMLVPSRAFPPHERFSEEQEPLAARDILRTTLSIPAVCAVVPGTASLEEAEENAMAGHDLPHEKEVAEIKSDIEPTIGEMQASLCSRCGECEPTCSQGLPVSWLFREAYIWNYPSDTFEALDRLHYFKLHPGETPTCADCTDQSCLCPVGLDIPASLVRVHEGMVSLRSQGQLHCTEEELVERIVSGHVTAGVVWSEVPERLVAGEEALCRLWLHNGGDTIWWTHHTRPKELSQALVVTLDDQIAVTRPLLHDVGPEQRCHFSFLLPAPWLPGARQLRVELRAFNRAGRLGAGTTLLEQELDVVENPRHSTRNTRWRHGLAVLGDSMGRMLRRPEVRT